MLKKIGSEQNDDDEFCHIWNGDCCQVETCLIHGKFQTRNFMNSTCFLFFKLFEH